MTNRWLRYALTIALAVVLLGLGAFAIHRAFVYEEPMLSGPLTADLLAAREPETRRQDLGAVFAQFIPEDSALAVREPVLVANGFNCALRPANVEGNTLLSCVRPVEGSGYCEGFIYYAYQTATGEILETLGSTYSADPGNGLFGRCENNRQFFLDRAADQDA